MSDYLSKLKRGPLLPDKGYSVTKELSDIFTNLIGGTDTIGIDPQEVGRGYTVQQPEPYQGMPSTPKGFKTVKSLDDFIGKKTERLNQIWRSANNKLREVWGKLDTEMTYYDFEKQYMKKRFGIDTEKLTLNEDGWQQDFALPESIKNSLDKYPAYVKSYQEDIRDLKLDTIDKTYRLAAEKRKPVLVNFKSKNDKGVYEFYDPDKFTDVGFLDSLKEGIKKNKEELIDAEKHKSRYENRIKEGYQFIIKNKDNLIKGFNDFVRQSADEMTADAKRLFGKPKLSLAGKEILDTTTKIERSISTPVGKTLGDVARDEYGLGGKYSSFKGTSRNDYDSDTSYINGMSEWRAIYNKMYDDYITDDDQQKAIKDITKKIDAIIETHKQKYPNLKLSDRPDETGLFARVENPSLIPSQSKKDTEIIFSERRKRDQKIKDALTRIRKEVEENEELASKLAKDKKNEIISKELGPKFDASVTLRNWKDFSREYKFKEELFKGSNRKNYDSDEEMLKGLEERYKNYNKMSNEFSITSDFRETLNEEMGAIYNEINDLRNKLKNKKD